jgi:hypothetical protein
MAFVNSCDARLCRLKDLRRQYKQHWDAIEYAQTYPIMARDQDYYGGTPAVWVFGSCTSQRRFFVTEASILPVYTWEDCWSHFV